MKPHRLAGSAGEARDVPRLRGHQPAIDDSDNWLRSSQSSGCRMAAPNLLPAPVGPRTAGLGFVEGEKLVDFIRNWNKLSMWEQLGWPAEECLTDGRLGRYVKTSFQSLGRAGMVPHLPIRTPTAICVAESRGFSKSVANLISLTSTSRGRARLPIARTLD